MNVVVRHRLNRIVPNDGNVHNDTVRIPSFALTETSFAKRDELGQSELHFDIPFSPC